jgi:hypothetical protein
VAPSRLTAVLTVTLDRQQRREAQHSRCERADDGMLRLWLWLPVWRGTVRVAAVRSDVDAQHSCKLEIRATIPLIISCPAVPHTCKGKSATGNTQHDRASGGAQNADLIRVTEN